MELSWNKEKKKSFLNEMEKTIGQSIVFDTRQELFAWTQDI